MRVFSLLVACLILMSGQSLSAAGRKEAVIIAVRHHRPAQPLPEQRYAESDASALADILSRSGYRVRLHSTQHARELQNDFLHPVSSYIRDSLSEAARSTVSHEDSLLIVLIGNAVLVPPAQPGASGHLCFCPMDADVRNLGRKPTPHEQASLMDFSEFYGALEESRAGNRLLIVDICRADPSFKPQRNYASTLTLPRIPAPNKGAGLILSCGPGQMSVEDGNLQRGVFMNYLIQAFEGRADLASSFDDGDRTVTLDELSNFVRDQTARHVSREYPTIVQTAELKGMPQGMWPLVRLSEQRPASIALTYHSSDSGTSGFLSSSADVPQFQRTQRSEWPDQANQPAEGTRGINWDTIPSSSDVDPSNESSIQQTNWTRSAGNPANANQGAGTNGKNLRRFTEFSVPFCWCPPGAFTMGSVTPSMYTDKNETAVRVSFSEGFWIAQMEVTRDLWMQVIPYTPWNEKLAQVDSGDLNLPAAGMTFEQACDFCSALTERERSAGRLSTDECYRLPTEAEWEYACRAGSTTDFCFGNRIEELIHYAAFKDANARSNPLAPQPVGSFRPNRWNIFDMHGNVAEFCLDAYQERHPGGIDPLVRQLQSQTHVQRGGNYRAPAIGCRSSQRGPVQDNLYHSALGFRIVLSRLHTDSKASSRIQNAGYIDPSYRN